MATVFDRDITSDNDTNVTNDTETDDNVCDICGKSFAKSRSVKFHKLKAHHSKAKTPPKDEPENEVTPQFSDDLNEPDEEEDELNDILEEVRKPKNQYPNQLRDVGNLLRRLGATYDVTKRILTLAEDDFDPDDLEQVLEIFRDAGLSFSIKRLFIQKWAKQRGLEISKRIEKQLGINRRFYDEYEDNEEEDTSSQINPTNEFVENLKAFSEIFNTNLRGNNTDPEMQKELEKEKILVAKMEEKLERERAERRFENMLEEKNNEMKLEMEKLRRENTDLTTEIFRDISQKMDRFLIMRQKFLVQGDNEKPPYKETKSSRQYDEIADDVNPKYRRVFNPVNSTFEKQKEIENGQAK